MLLQSPECDISRAVDFVKSRHETFRSTDAAASLARSWALLKTTSLCPNKVKRFVNERSQDESPKSADKREPSLRLRVNTFFATVDRACTQIKLVFLTWIQSPWHSEFYFPPPCCRLLHWSICSNYVSRKAGWYWYFVGFSSSVVFILFMFSFTAVDQVYHFGSFPSAANWSPRTLYTTFRTSVRLRHFCWRCNLRAFFLKAETDQKFPSKYCVSGASQWPGGYFDTKTACKAIGYVSCCFNAFAQQRAQKRKRNVPLA